MFQLNSLVKSSGLLAVLLALAVSNAPAAPLSASAGGMALTLSFSPDPPTAAQNRLELTLKDPGGRPIDGAKVSFDTSMYTMSMPGPSAAAVPGGSGSYTASLLFGMAGPWEVTAHVSAPGRPRASASFRFTVGDTGPAAKSPPATPVTRVPAASTATKTAPGSPAIQGPAQYDVSIDTTPPPIGQGAIVVRVRDRQTGQPVTGGRVIAKASMPSMPMGETFHEAAPVPGSPGTFRLSWPFQMAGDWKITAEYQGEKGAVDASAAVSPGAFVFPVWAAAILGIAALALILALGSSLRTARGRERLKGMAQPKNLAGLLVLVAVALGAWLLVRHFKAGQVDWNQMSMQMQDYTAPTPVSVQPARYGTLGSVLTYTGSVTPFVEDTIYPRVTGRIVQTLYPGDPVTAGQVIVRLDEPDLVAKADQAHFAVTAAVHDVIEARNRVQQAQDALAAARAAAQGSQGGVREAEQAQVGAGGAVAQAESDLQAARDDRLAALADASKAQAAVRQARAKLVSAQADQGYWQSEIPREAALLARGAVSQDEYQNEIAKSQASAAAVDEARAELSSAEAGVAVAQARSRESESKIAAAQAALSQSVAARGGQAAKVSQAYASETGSLAAIRNAIHGVELAGHEVTHSQAMLAQTRAAEAEAEANLGYLTLRAPESGVVTKRLADPGTVVSPGTGILKVAQLDRVRIQANVSTSDLDLIHVGTPVTAIIHGAPSPIHARVTDVFPAASETSRTGLVEAVVPNPGGRLVPGSFATLQFRTEPARQAIIVPETAVVSLTEAGVTGSGQSAGSGVWLAQGGTAHLAPVQTGASDGVNQEILTGIKEGDLVIVSGMEGLTEGAAITYPGMPQLGPKAGQTSAAAVSAGGGGLVARAGALTVSLSFQPSPPQVGEEKLIFTITDAGGSTVKGATVAVTSEMPSMSMGGPSGAARDNGDGTYTLPLTMGMGGDWRVTAAVTPPGGSAATARFNFKVQ